MKDIQSMTLREKVGQLVLCGFEGKEPSAEIKELIQKHNIGGVIYFDRNVRNVEQVARLSEDLQALASDAGTLPLIVSIDQEGGMVARITEGVALMPGNMAVAAGGDSNAAYEAGRICGIELNAMGINLNFAPVLDVNNNPRNPVIGVRSYGESPELVSEYGVNMLKGLQESNVIATAKHFPGHGDTDVDSHLDLPRIGHDQARIRSLELVPFLKAMEAGVDSIMSSHIDFPAFDSSGLPVTLSKAVLTGLLREELGYQGVVMTDCMEMDAIAEHFGTVKAAVMAIEAGADWVLISHRYDRQLGAIEAIVEAVEAGRISEERINESVERILALKAKRGLFEKQESVDLSVVGNAEHMAVAQRISENSVTLVKDTGSRLPLKANKTLVISMQTVVSSLVDDAIRQKVTLGDALKERGLDVVERVVPIKEVASLVDGLVKEASDYDQIVVGTYNARQFPQQAELVKRLEALGKSLVVVATRNPYDIELFGEISTYVVVYESRKLALRSAAKFLMGEIPAPGKLTVSLGDGTGAGGQ